MKLLIAYVVFKLLVDGVFLALVIDAQNEQREKEKINQDEKQLIARLQEGIDKYNSEAKRLEELYRERKRMYNPCNYGGHDREGDGETVVKNVCGDCKHYYNYVCENMEEMTLRQAIEHLDESLGDASRDWGCEECRREHEQLRAWLVELEQLKESGAVPVVRCKDCKWWKKEDDPTLEEEEQTLGRCELLGSRQGENWYCWYGRRERW